MADLNRVIADLRCCLDEKNPDDCRGCSYHGMWGCVGSVMADALELLKEYRRCIGNCDNCGHGSRDGEGYLHCDVLDRDKIRAFGNCPSWIPKEERE